MIVIVDYGVGNIRNVERALTKLGMEVIVTRDIEMIDLVQRVRMPYNISALTQAVARVAVRNIEQMRAITQTMIEQRNRIVAQLSTLPIEIFESHTNFILYRSDRYVQLMEAFEGASIGVRAYPKNPLLKNCIRISLGTIEANDAVIAVFKEVYQDV